MATGTFCCGGGCGVTAANTLLGGRRHWDTTSGSGVAPTTVATPFWWAPGGPQCYQFAETGSGFFFERNFDASPTGAVLRFAIGLTGGAYPSSTTDLVTVRVSGLLDVIVRFNLSDKTLRVHHGGAPEAVGPVMQLDTRYAVDLSVDVSNNPNVVQWRVNGAAQTTVQLAQAASTLTVFRYGVQSSVSITVNMGDLFVTQTLGDYPIGDGKVQAYFASGDGTHVYSAGTDFKYNNATPVPTPSSVLTDSYAYIDDGGINNINDFMACSGASNTEYLEWFCQAPNAGELAPLGVEVVSGHHASGGGGNKMTLRLNDGGTLVDVWTDIDVSSSTLISISKHFATAPSGGAWTLAKVAGLRVRFNSSYGTPQEGNVPFIDALAFEVAFPPTPPGGFTGDFSASEIPLIIQPVAHFVSVWGG